ncbi:MAG TPA: hypothetical protein VFN35_23805, partial [Ktedonobacteraceae bacterium]|nr:hypothetical protein [Ktedonobacteraceae bacterium]
MKLLFRFKIPLLMTLASLLLFLIIRPFLFTNSTSTSDANNTQASNEQSSASLERSKIVNTFTGTG